MILGENREPENPPAYEVDLPDAATWARLRRRQRFDKDGTVVSDIAESIPLNAHTILQHDPRLTGCVRRCELSGQTQLRGKQIRDTDVTDLQIWLSATYGVQLAAAALSEIVEAVAARQPRHPIREYLDEARQRWDGVSRVDTWLTTHLGADDSQLTLAISRAWLISCVARVQSPGCQVDTTLILVGPQGALKSSAFRTMASPQWFSDSHVDLRSKEGYGTVRGVWIQEFAELDSLNRRDSTTIKAFLSARIDHYRPPYGRHTVSVPRQCVFVGTTNKDQFLSDPTGDRRYWPIRVGTIDLGAVARDRDQIWGEAMKRWSDGEAWHLSAEAEAERSVAAEGYREEDAWHGPVEAWLRGQSSATVADILHNALDRDIGTCTPLDQQRIGAILVRIGWRRRGYHGRVRTWVPGP